MKIKNLETLGNSPEVTSYVYQQISEFQPFVTPQTLITVLAESESRVLIRLQEDGGLIESKGSGKNIYAAIAAAKENMLKQLVAIQDQVESEQDRQIQINHFLQNSRYLH